MKKIIAAYLMLMASIGIAVPLDTFTTYVTAHPNEARKGPFAQLLARGTGTNDMYVLEVDPTTGALPVDANFSLSNDTDYGAVGVNTLRTASQIGNATGAAAFGAGNYSAQTLRVVVASDQPTINVNSTFTPNVTDYGVTTNAQRVAAQIGNATGAADFGSGTRSAQTQRVTIATDDVVPASQSGTWNINNVSGTVSLPTGASTEAKQDTGNTSLSSIDGKLGTLGQKTMTGSAPVVIASDQSAIPASQSGTWNITNVSGTVSLPTGASTESTLSTLNGKVANDYGVSTGAVRTAAQLGNASGAADFGSGAAGAQTLRTVLSTRQESVTTPLAAQLSNGSSAVDYNSGAAGSATLRTVLATRHESVSTPLAAQLSNGTAALDYGSGSAGTATLRVVPSTRSEAAATPLAVRISDGSSFSIPQPAGRSYADSVRLAYSSTNVTSGAWVQLIASTAATINQLKIFHSCGYGVELGTGAAAAESRKLLIPPGGFDSDVNLAIASGTRISLRALSTTCDTGEIILTGLN
jgi:hypothetical protein